MSNELIFLLLTLYSLGVVMVAGLLGRTWLYGAIIALALTSSVTAGKVMTVFGVSASAATPIYAGIFLATDALSEFFGAKSARESIWLGLGANLALVLGGQLVVSTVPAANLEVAAALETLFAFIPRLVVAGLLAFIVAQHLDIWIFHALRRKTNGKRLWLRNNVSTFVSQFVDSLIVYGIAFWGLVPNVMSLVWVAWGMKVVVAAVDTPFLYLMRRLIGNDRTGSDQVHEST